MFGKFKLTIIGIERLADLELIDITIKRVDISVEALNLVLVLLIEQMMTSLSRSCVRELGGLELVDVIDVIESAENPTTRRLVRNRHSTRRTLFRLLQPYIYTERAKCVQIWTHRRVFNLPYFNRILLDYRLL